MKRISYFGLAVMALVSIASVAYAVAPNPTTSVFHTRIFNDCPESILSTAGAYPGAIFISDDAADTCHAFANLHNWRFSTDGVNAVEFSNGDVFRFSADLVIDGPGQAESGIQISPWWSQDVEGRINVRTTDGEIALFGGFLPFFNFTATYGITYIKGTPIRLELNYNPHSNTQADPGTLEAKITYAGQNYTSGILPFNNCNPADPPHGCYGVADNTTVGGHIQCLWFPGQNNEIHSTWTNIQYHPDVKPTAASNSSWGRLKTIYR
jgi:hypothetical protein